MKGAPIVLGLGSRRISEWNYPLSCGRRDQIDGNSSGKIFLVEESAKGDGMNCDEGFQNGAVELFGILMSSPRSSKMVVMGVREFNYY